MHIADKPELKNRLAGKTVLITGAGNGIGLEAAKAFAYMGAKIVIAEINQIAGRFAENTINTHYPNSPAKFNEVDLSDEKQLYSLIDFLFKNYGCPDIIFNNATITRMGAVDDVDIGFWDHSYAVNFKAPLLLAQKFLPKMKERKSGTIVFVSSSGASPFMGAYEVFKTAQVELCNTLAMELENSGVYTFSIGPGLVKTETATKAIEIISQKMGMSTEQFYNMNSQHILDAESAGTGFALSVVNPERYNGQEIGSIQVLMDYGLLSEPVSCDEKAIAKLSANDIEKAIELLTKIQLTFEQQYSGWRAMNVFERQWVLRDFKKNMGMSAEQADEYLRKMLQEAKTNFSAILLQPRFFKDLCGYWKHQLKLLQGYEKDKNKLAENTKIIEEWILDIESLLTYFN